METLNIYKIQRETLSEQLSEYKKEFGAVKRLRQINIDKNLSLTPLQKFIVNQKVIDSKDFLSTFRMAYNVKQRLKVLQIDNLAKGNDPLTETRYTIFVNGVNFRNFATIEKAKESAIETFPNLETLYTIDETTRDIRTTFSVGEMLRVSQSIDKKYSAYFTDKATITLERIKKALEADKSE